MGCLLHYRVAIVIGTVYIFGHFERVRGQSALFIVTYRMHTWMCMNIVLLCNVFISIEHL